MIGVLSYGGFVPRYRLDRKAIVQAMGWFNPATYGLARGTKAVASHDEDSVTLAVAACIDCLGDTDRNRVDGLFLGSTTLPFQLRQGASLVSAALDLGDGVRSADLTDCHRAGTSALLAALDSAAAGSTTRTLAVAADCRIARAGSSEEHLFGDGAAALLVGEGDALAMLTASHSEAFDFVDGYRADGAAQQRGWEDRWVRDEGFGKLLPRAIGGLLAKTGTTIDDYDRVIYPCRFARDHAKIGKRLGLAPEKLQDPLMGAIGDTGAAHALLMLAAALDQAQPGEKLLVAAFGSGVDVLALQVTEHITAAHRADIAGQLARQVDLGSYQMYSTFRELTDAEFGIRGEFQAPTALSVLWRDNRRVLGLVGSRCTACGTPQYPAQNICVNPECLAVEQSEPYRFSDRAGTIFTFTGDHLAFCVEPPQIYGIVDPEGGGRLFVDFSDCTLADLRVGGPVRMMLRRKYHDRQRQFHGYFWKAVPAAASTGEERHDG